MANPAVVQAVDSAYATGTTHTISMTGVTAGNLLVVVMGIGSSLSISSCSGGGATWGFKASAGPSSPSSLASIAISVGTGTTGGSITITVGTGSGFAGATCYEISNGTYEAATGAGAVNNGTPSSSSAPTMTPTTTGDLVLTAIFGPATATGLPSSPWVGRLGPQYMGGSHFGPASAYQAGCTGGTGYTATYTTGGDDNAVAALVITAAGGGGTKPPPPIVKWQDAVRHSYLY